jgi:hypothetical protein
MNRIGGKMVEKLKIEGLEEQLAELAKILNSFKSEAVQLRILDYVLGDDFSSASLNQPTRAVAHKKLFMPSKPSKEKTGAIEAPIKKKAKAGTGAPASLTQLVEGNFFATPRTINDIIEYCKHNLARTFKANEFSGKLSRLVRNGTLTREKNADGQYEYKKP